MLRQRLLLFGLQQVVQVVQQLVLVLATAVHDSLHTATTAPSQVRSWRSFCKALHLGFYGSDWALA